MKKECLDEWHIVPKVMVGENTKNAYLRATAPPYPCGGMKFPGTLIENELK